MPRTGFQDLCRRTERSEVLLRRWLIWTHRYVGIPLSPLFVLWFLSGVVMMYTGGMPELTPAARIEHRAALDLSRVRLTPAAAAARGGVTQPPAAAKLLAVMGRLVVAANTLQPRHGPFDAHTLVERLRAALPAIPLAGATQLESYDSYYYGRGVDRPPLPVIRIRFADPMRTWIYVDPAVNRIVGTVHRYSRLERWLFNGLHSLDFAFWYQRRPLWDIGLIALMFGGLASSGIGLWLGIKRVRRALGR